MPQSTTLPVQHAVCTRAAPCRWKLCSPQALTARDRFKEIQKCQTGPDPTCTDFTRRRVCSQKDLILSSGGSVRPAVFRSSTYVFSTPEAAERAFNLVQDEHNELRANRLLHPLQLAHLPILNASSTTLTGSSMLFAPEPLVVHLLSISPETLAQKLPEDAHARDVKRLSALAG
jgi:hypothetical protein